MVKPKSKKRRSPPRDRLRAELVPVVPADPTAQFTGLARQAEPEKKRIARLLQAFFAKRSDLTVRNYRVDLVHFGRWWRAGGHDLDARGSKRKQDRRLDLDGVAVGNTDQSRDEFVAHVLRDFHALDQLNALGVVLAYQNDLGSGVLGRVFSPQTINHRIAALRAVTNMARLLEMCHFHLDDVDTLEINRTRSTEGCGPDGFLRLIAQAEADVEGADGPADRIRATRIAVILHLMHGSGLRRFEGLQLLWPDDVDLPGKRIRFRGKKRRTKEWFQCLSNGAIAAIRRHLQERGAESGYLLHGSELQEPLSVRTVNRIVSDIAKRSDVAVTPHGIRHTAATTMLERSGGNVRAVAQFLRHKGLGTVQEYDDARQQLPQRMSDLLDEPVAKPKRKPR